MTANNKDRRSSHSSSHDKEEIEALVGMPSSPKIGDEDVKIALTSNSSSEDSLGHVTERPISSLSGATTSTNTDNSFDLPQKLLSKSVSKLSSTTNNSRFTLSNMKPLKSAVLEKRRLICSKDFLKKKFPCFGLARNYNLDYLVSDIIAGLTLALTAIPLGIGYVALAELPLQYGLYASIAPGFIYAIFGTCKEVTIGPTAVNSLMSYNYAGPSVQGALTLAFFSGLIEMTAGILNLGFLTNFISAPVIAAFTSAVSINVMTSQVKGFLGLKEIAGRGFRNTWLAVFQNIRSIRPVDASIGFVSLGIILLLRNLRNFHFGEGDDPTSKRALMVKKIKWLIVVSRNSLVLIAGSVLSYILVEVYNLEDIVYITGEVPPGVPEFNLPWRFGLNSTETGKGPFELASDFGSGLVMIPLVSMIQIIAIVHNFSHASKNVDSTQEILALGLCQLVSSFMGSLCITASFGRSSVNKSSGVRTPFGGIVTGSIVIAACAFLTPHLAYIPSAALAAVIISSVVLTIDIEILIPIWKSKKIDALPYCITFFVGVFVSVEWGMIGGTLTHLGILLYRASQPRVKVGTEKMDGIQYILIQPIGELNFPSVDRIRLKISGAAELEFKQMEIAGSSEDSNEISKSGGNGPVFLKLPIIFDLSKVADIDFSTARALRALAKSMASDGLTIQFCGASQKVEDILQGVDASLFMSYDNIKEAARRLNGP